jgi:hypothetical protein
MMETFEPLVFYKLFESIGPDGPMLKHMYFRFVSSAMFLLRGGPIVRLTAYESEGEALEHKLRDVNDTI